MIYKAVVLDNSMLFTRGTIRVRIAGFYNKKIVWNLEERFPDTLTEGDVEGDVNTQFSNDFEAQLIAPFGGGRNYGALIIPQVNEKGLVTFLGTSKSRPIWLGGLFETKRDENFNVEFVNFPSDKFEDGENTDGVLNDEGNIGDDIELQEEKSIIIRTKHTNTNSAEEIDFQQQETSNIITVGKRRIKATHFPENSWEEGKPKVFTDFLIGQDEDGNDVIRLLNKNHKDEDFVEFELTKEHGILSLTKGGTEQARFSMDEEDIILFNKEGENKISFTDSGVEIYNRDGNNKITFNDSDEIEIENDSGSKITMTSSGTIQIMGDMNVEIMGNAHTAVRLEQLLDIIDQFETHTHISYGPGPTGPAMGPPGAPTIDLLIMAFKNQLGSRNIKVE